MASDTSVVFNVLARDKASRVLGVIGGAFRSTAAQAEEALSGATADTAKLDAELERVESSLRELDREFAGTGDKELFAKIKRDRTLLTNLRSIKRELDDVGDAADRAGDRSGRGFLDRFKTGLTGLPDVVSGGFSAMPPQVKGAVVAAAAAVGAVFIAGLGAAILLGLGGGVLAAGIMLAAKDPKVAEAWKAFGGRAKKSLSGFTDAFKGPVTRAAGTFGAAIERMSPAFTRIGQTMAPIIDKLAPALASMAEKAMPGIEKAIKASAPLFDKLAQHLPKIGEAVSSFFDSISDSGPGAVIFLDLILTSFAGLIRFWGNGIEFWSNTLEVLNTFFTDKVPAAWNWLVAKIKAGVSAISGFFTGMKDWIVGKWNALVGFVSGIPGRISRAAHGMWDGIKNSFRSAVNWIIGKWNGLSFRLPGVSIPGIGQVWGGMTLGTPDIPYLAKGGTATRSGLAVVGERGPELVSLTRGAQVTPLTGRGGTAVVELRSGGSRLDDLLVEILRRAINDRGGNVQAVLGKG